MIAWKIAATMALLSLQVFAIVGVRRCSHERLVRLQLWRTRGDDLIPELRRQSEERRDNPEELRRTATLSVVFCTLALDGFIAWIWLF
jgi:hypothetical protein